MTMIHLYPEPSHTVSSIPTWCAAEEIWFGFDQLMVYTEQYVNQLEESFVYANSFSSSVNLLHDYLINIRSMDTLSIHSDVQEESSPFLDQQIWLTCAHWMPVCWRLTTHVLHTIWGAHDLFWSPRRTPK